jgi:hypothetical protein
MKKLLLLLLMISFFSQCKQAEKKEAKITDSYLVSEELQRYAISALDSVWSVKLVLQSADTAVVKYRVDLTHNGITYPDSLIFSLRAGEEVNGQVIFSDCATKNNPKPSFTSKVTRLE